MNRFMTPAEALVVVVVVAAVLFLVVFMEGNKGALKPIVGVLLLGLAIFFCEKGGVILAQGAE